MACEPHIDFPEDFFLVIVPGNQRATSFHDAADDTAYLARANTIAATYRFTPRKLAGAGHAGVTHPEMKPANRSRVGRRLHRDPSMISSLAATYDTSPDPKIESRILELLQVTPASYSNR